VTPPKILFVDDATDLIGSIVDEVAELGAEAGAFLPEEVKEEDLNQADLVLLDFDLGKLEYESPVPPLLRAHDGLGFAQIIRSYHRAHNRTGAVALLSDKLPRLFGTDLPHLSEHGIARLHGLEWAFDKNASDPGPAERIMDLAHATVTAAEHWSPAAVPEDLVALLEFVAMPESTPWSRHATLVLGSTQPPAHELAASTRGLSVVRWLSHRILPYPGLLLDDRHAAVLLGVTPDSFSAALESSALRDRLASAEYEGALSHFAGRRWWSSAIQRVVIEITGGAPISDPAAIQNLNDQTGAQLVPTPGRAVVALDVNLEAYAAPVPRHEVVRIRPDDWPVFAEPAYAPISLFLDDDDEDVRRLRSYIDPADMPLLHEAGSG
jgi:hypothetical protein